MIKLYAIVLAAIFLVFLNAGAVAAIFRSRDARRTVRLLIVFAAIFAVSLFFWHSFKIVILSTIGLIGLALLLWYQAKGKVSNPSR